MKGWGELVRERWREEGRRDLAIAITGGHDRFIRRYKIEVLEESR